MITGDSIHQEPIIYVKRNIPFWHTCDYAALIIFVKKEEIFIFGIFGYFFSWCVQFFLFFHISAQEKCLLLQTYNSKPRENVCINQQMLIQESRGWESWIWGLCCRDRYMLTATLTSFSGELGLVSSFCLNKMFDTVSDFFPLSWVCFSPSSVCGFLGEGAGLSINFPGFFFWLYIIRLWCSIFGSRDTFGY